MTTIINNIGGLQFCYTLDAKAEATTVETASTETIDVDVLLDFQCDHQVTLLSDSTGDTLLVTVTDSKSGIVQSAHLCWVDEVAGHRLKSIASGKILLAMVPSEALSDAVIDGGGEAHVEPMTWWEMRNYDMAKHDDGIWRPHYCPPHKIKGEGWEDMRDIARRRAVHEYRNLVNAYICRYDT